MIALDLDRVSRAFSTTDGRGFRALAVRAVAAFRQDRHAARGFSSANQRRSDRFELAGLGPWIARAVDHQRRHAEIAEPAPVQIRGRRRWIVRDPQPRIAVRPDQIAPEVAVIVREHARHPIAEAVGVAHHRFKKLARRRFAAEEVCGFHDQAAQPIGIGQPHQQRNDRAIAVPPHDGAIERQRVNHRKRFGRGAMVKIGVLPDEPSRSAVSRAIGNDEAMVRGQRRDLPVEGIDLVTPPAVEDHDRASSAGVAVLHSDRRHPRRQGGRRQIDVRHE